MKKMLCAAMLAIGMLGSAISVHAGQMEDNARTNDNYSYIGA